MEPTGFDHQGPDHSGPRRIREPGSNKTYWTTYGLDNLSDTPVATDTPAVVEQVHTPLPEKPLKIVDAMYFPQKNGHGNFVNC